ncbi:MFS transporter [Paenibacillus sp. JX-17]|uniref:MFS transporter n=1 Tax=Paenibacillus lacisoli TaxID=3064525 RepID=A0ABT9C7U0_9BACL|nr:MFS transporter [Paenibacillus sp. JX-17]MDO7905296.1 MFS transporter [Paenibacillus sp. JX-17]
MKQERQHRSSNGMNERRRLLSPFFIELWSIVFLVEFLKGSLLVAVLPVYMGDVLGLTAGVIGVAFSLQYLGDNLFRAPSGWAAERLGYRGTMAAALAFTLISVLLITFTSGAGWLILSCLVLGVGTSPLWPCVMTGTTEISGPNNSNGAAMGTLEIAALGGTGLGPIVMNYLLAHTSQNYRTIFLVLIGSSIVMILISLLLPGRVRGKAADANAASAEPAQAGPPFSINAQLRKLKRSVSGTMQYIRGTLKLSPLVYPSLFMQSFVIGLLSPVITLYTRTELGISPNMYSLLLIVGGGLTMLALIPFGKLVDRFGTRVFLNIGFLFAGCALFVFALVRSLPLVFLLVSLVGLGYAMILPAWNTFVAGLVPKGERGAVWGFFLTLQGSGMVVGPIVSGLLWDKLGHTVPFMASGIVMWLLLLSHLTLTRRRDRTA